MVARPVPLARLTLVGLLGLGPASCAVPGPERVTPVEVAPTAPLTDMPPLPAGLWADDERVRGVLSGTSDFSQAMPFERMAGGAGTSTRALDRDAYSHHTGTLSFEQLQRFKLGNALFNKLWVSSPASTLASDGLGPFWNARACESCHAGDGRGQRPEGEERAVSLVVQLADVSGALPAGDPIYGVQLHTAAVPGVTAEARVRIEHETVTVRFEDGDEQALSSPRYVIDRLGYGPLDESTRLSPRLAPSVIGQGLLEAIDEAAILAREDPQDLDGDGISGRANWQALPGGQRRIGRFGHKAGKATVRQQTGHAFKNDMGLSNAVADDPDGDCTISQPVCDELADGVQTHLGTVEVPDELLDLVTFYTANLAVPARRDVGDAQVLAGKALFARAGCVGCHVPRHVTAANAARPEHRFQLIWPYTDLLLHDTGEALADGAGNERTDGEARGHEWRTAPLWGIGAATTVNPRTGFLHDGRAATPMEAVLWHGGEALASRDRVLAMSRDERAALERFLDSL